MNIAGLTLIKPKIFQDDRGFFLESFRSSWDFGVDFVQDNHSFSKKNVLRGMHFQKGQAKLVRCVSGRIFDVAVDMRPSSPTYGMWEGVILDSENHHELFIPDGCAHGFCVLSDGADVCYKVSAYYDSKLESGFRFDDPGVGIVWPVKEPIISRRDRVLDYWQRGTTRQGNLSEV